MKALVTGGAGYIGSHTCVELLAAGHGSSSLTTCATARKRRCSGLRRSPASRRLRQADIRDRDALDASFRADVLMPSSISQGSRRSVSPSRIPSLLP